MILLYLKDPVGNTIFFVRQRGQTKGLEALQEHNGCSRLKNNLC